MSGTNHAVEIAIEPQPRVILVRPQLGENIGSAARAMWNFGLQNMTLVNPRDGWPNPAAGAMASGAAVVLDNVIVADDLPSATGDLHFTFATTARMRGLTKPVLSPKAAMERARAEIHAGRKVGILFGPERAGMENEDLTDADALISIPVNPAFGSLNLAQAVLLLAYEWKLSDGSETSDIMEWADAQPATREERHHLQKALEERLDEVGFFWPEDKATAMRTSLRNMFGRMPLSNIDVRTFHGIFRTLWRGEKLPNKRK